VADYSLYSYSKSGDIKGSRTLEWIDKWIFKEYLVKEYWKVGSSILDVGSGNGRVNSILVRYFDIVYNIDVIIDIDRRFDYDNVVYHRGNFVYYEFDRKFDVISFFMSFLAFPDKPKAIAKCLELLNPNGFIFIADDVSWEDGNKKINRYLTYNLNELCEKFNLVCDSFITKKVKTKCSFIRRK